VKLKGLVNSWVQNLSVFPRVDQKNKTKPKKDIAGLKKQISSTFFKN